MAKQVLRYLKNIISLGIQWERNPTNYKSDGRYGELGMMEYTDSSYVGEIEDRNSIARYYFFFGRAIMTWYSKQQRRVSTSTSESKYVAVNQGVRERVWIQ